MYIKKLANLLQNLPYKFINYFRNESLKFGNQQNLREIIREGNSLCKIGKLIKINIKKNFFFRFTFKRLFICNIFKYKRHLEQFTLFFLIL